MFLIFFIILSLPFVLLGIERFLPYPYIVEEVGKAFVISLVLRQEKRFNVRLFTLVVLSALWFVFIESLLFALPYKDPVYFTARFIFTGSFHFYTFILFYFLGKKSRGFKFLSLSIMIISHYIFNLYIR